MPAIHLFRKNGLQLLTLGMLVSMSTGCTMLSGIPVNRVPREILQVTQKDDFEDISMLRLRQDPPESYTLGPGDVIGFHIYEQGSGSFTNPNGPSRQSNVPLLPAVDFPEDSTLPPFVGSPVVVQEDGTITLPIIEPLHVEGMSMTQVADQIRRAYTIDADHFPDETQFSLTMIHRRTVRVLVIREESGGIADVSKRGTGHVLDLPVNENDVLRALSQTGGMPGTDAKNEILIYRGTFMDGVNYDQVLNGLCLDNCDDPCFCDESPRPDPPNVTRIPLRYHPSQPPVFSQQDVILNEGDIVIIRSRDKETFYTAGLLGGGEFPLPRDKDLDIIGAIALARGPLGSIGTGIGGIGSGQGGGNQNGRQGYCQPSEALIVRELPCGNQITIKIDLNRALSDRSERVLIKPGDVIMLRYTIGEEIGNVVLSLIQFNFLFSGFSGNGF